MKQILRSGFLMIMACVAVDLGARAQVVLYSTDFPDDQGWVFQALNSNAWWAVDDTPGICFGGPSNLSAPFSLNFNNGSCIGGAGCGGTSFGIATSPAIDLGAANGSVVLGFWCNYHCESSAFCDGKDRRSISVLNSVGLVAEYCFTAASCGPVGQPHFHSLQLAPSWGVIHLKFYLDTSDWMFNDGAGWFIDDLSVIGECASTAPYCTPKLNSLGCSPTIFTTGTPSLSGSGQAFRIWAGGVLNQKVGLMLWSRSPASTPLGGGTLCVGAPITRTAAQSSGGSSLPAMECDGFYSFQFSPAMMSQAGLLVGDDVYSQYWSRDNGFAPPDNVGLTAGVHWKVCP